MRVCIDARTETGLLGGVEQVVIGLAHGLSRLDDGSEEYLFLTTPGKDAWILPYLHGPCRAMPAGEPPVWALRRYKARDWLSRHLPFVRRPLTPQPGPERVMISDGTVEWAGIDVVHFPCQMAFLTQVPSIYHPHDLQHLHLPELFTEEDLELRGLWYRAFCEQAALVVMMTSWGRRDLIRHFGLPPEKVVVVPWGSVMDAYPQPSPQQIAETRAALGLPDRFIFYPAQTWRHKNHEGLLETLALIRDRHGEVPPLVCSGHLNDFHPTLERRASELGLQDSVNFVGFVTPLELRCLYEMATALVFPSRFEGWGMPVSEAFASDLPVASSSATGLDEVVGEAALTFDPERPDQIADAVWRLWTDPQLRATLVERGRRRSEGSRVDHAVRVFRAHYRRIAGRRLSDEDRALLTSPPPAAAEGVSADIQSPAA
ncbi:MAG: glycosyltransferase family 1 protein [Solirubrobacterales bacterium]